VIRPAVPEDAEPIAASLARAFDDDPVARYSLPSDRRRAGQLRRFYLQRMRTLLPEELVFCDQDRRGAALWAPPDRWRTPLSELVRTRIVTSRLPLFLVGGMRVEHRHPREPHYYLAILGVDPAAQGEGIGSRLMQPMLERCDAEGVGAYLESSKESNVAFYARHGFRVTGEVKLVFGPKLWLMWRDPR
jgi:ribosomal protein S18 acetylase RimI-like enzyme